MNKPVLHALCAALVILSFGHQILCAAESEPLSVLMITGGQFHDYKTLPGVLAGRLSERGGVKVEILDDLRRLDPARLPQLDVLLFNTCEQTDVPEPLRQAILGFVRDGKGLAAMHCSLWSYQNWPEWEQLLGGFAPGHDKFGAFPVTVLDPEHAIVASAGKRFEITDEPYYIDKRDPADDVLARRKSGSKTADGQKRPDYEPQVWVKEYGKGRVFVMTFGHDDKSQSDEHFIALLHNGIRWAARRLPETPHNRLTQGEQRAGFKLLFNGKDLDGWEPDPEHWSVESGELVGSTEKNPLKHNQFLICKEQFGDFVLKYSIKLRNHNSGVQIRSVASPEFVVKGYQSDAADGWYGSLYEEKGRGILVKGWEQGKKVAILEGWNETTVRAVGPKITITLNGATTAEYEEKDASQPTRGVIALQLHQGPPMEVRFRDIKIQPLDK